MKKFNLLFTPILLLFLMMFISCPQEIKPEILEDKYSTINFNSFPEEVKEINIYSGDTCIATLHSNYSSKVFRNLEGELKIDVVYKDLTNSDSKYIGYGILENDSTPFTIFLNNKELENESDFEYTAYYINPDEEIQTNLKLHYISTFTCNPDQDKLEFTFQNSPKKILKTDVRLRDETIYSYFDCSELDNNLIATFQEQVGNNVYTFTQVTEGGLYYVNKFSQLLLTIDSTQTYKIIHYDFKANENIITDDNSTDKIFTHTFYENRTGGQIIKITGPSPVPKWIKKIEIDNLPEHVTDCNIASNYLSKVGYPGNDNFNIYFSDHDGESETKFEIFIRYEKIYNNNSSEFDCFGNLSTDNKPLKVYANGKEINNTYYEHAFYPDENTITNAQFKFEGTFECSDDLIKITFENSPRLVSPMEVRLLNDTNISYFDLSEVGSDIHTTIKFIDENNEVTWAYQLAYFECPNNTISFMELTPSFSIYFLSTNNYDFPSLDTFYIDDEPIGDKLVEDGYYLKYVYDKPRTSGQLIKITTGDAVEKASE